MKILDAGSAAMSNMEVLLWIEEKRAQHSAEDAEARAAKAKPRPRPKNFMDALKKHQRVLKSKQYPYDQNPDAYSNKTDKYASMRQLDEKICEEIIYPLEEGYKGNGMKSDELEASLGKEQEAKELTETEHLMIHNLAPKCLEQFQPIIENLDERYTAEEQEKIVEAINSVYRCNEAA
ncbi:Hypothetical protein R9X50_00304400 [Acrodontium crateriforme]|uniref:DNA-directed RNA polymerase III subunit RPC9 n=1 Tax=Acrodontium crateriforme TaxID=150365 RepID=A0AAQ3M5H0_9PEZI|nr:Hypothetical protein R9X50_00304400 [Acrodontium crateriforme]